jgi:thiamine-phosphate pyrophosphorylase
MVILRERDLPDAELGALVSALLPLRETGTRLMVSRRLDVARAYGLDGVHLAADAVAVEEARRWLGDGAVIGYSAHSPEEGCRVAAAGVDYVTLSPVYATESKPGAPARGTAWLGDAAREIPVPVLGLGGVTDSRAADVIGSGAWGVAVVSAIGAAPDVEEAAGRMLRIIEEAIS